ncbi:MAG: hypothetical protein OXQ90_21210, partial [Gammaproteobacteria bacterium]|nr:hypothetical protein [Gammaproteobacteria bacterium]
GPPTLPVVLARVQQHVRQALRPSVGVRFTTWWKRDASTRPLALRRTIPRRMKRAMFRPDGAATVIRIRFGSEKITGWVQEAVAPTERATRQWSRACRALAC